MNLKEKAVLITGGSRGLGRALAVEFARRGARVVIAARPSKELEHVESEIRDAGGIAYALGTDVSDKNAIYPLAAQAALLAGPIDLLVNNASTLGPTPLQLLIDTDCEDLERALATNLLGAFRLTKAVVGSMILRQNGLVINISSDAAVSAYPAWGAYSITKAALDHMTRIWAVELESTSLKLLSVDPGEMDTQMHSDAIPDADRSQLARPRFVAEKIVNLVENSEAIPTGSRLLAQEWKNDQRNLT